MQTPYVTARPQAKAFLVGVDFGESHFDDALAELKELASTAGFVVVGHLTCKRKAPDPALFIGSGKADEIETMAQAAGATEILFDQALGPAQQRNLERFFKRPVSDRILLILEIFAQRARSHEGKLQVELARLQYESTRLVRRWSHLERQTGGIGLRGGPGETQIELDRRMLTDSIKRTKERLAKLTKQRSTQRKQRQRNQVFNVSLVGYTNAGKSSLFNALVKAKAYAADQLFATLDTTTRQWFLTEAQTSVSLSDTVGFIKDLPHSLVAAFSATLAEAQDADLLLHVVDASNPAHPEQIREVMRVLREIGAGDIEQILVFNKLDQIAPEKMPLALSDFMELDGVSVPRTFLSAQTGQGLDVLRAAIAQRVPRPEYPAGGWDEANVAESNENIGE